MLAVVWLYNSGIGKHVMLKKSFISGVLLILLSTILAMSVGSVTPLERNIIYLHAPPAITALLCFVVLFICSMLYLKTSDLKWDFYAAASGEVGLVLAVMLNITGMIFARLEWGIWWTPSLRLISSAVMLFLYAAYCLFRASTSEKPQAKKMAAVFGIIAFIDVPLVFVSARFISDVHRPDFSFESPIQYLTFAMGVVGTIIFAACLVWLRKELLKIQNKLSTLS